VQAAHPIAAIMNLSRPVLVLELVAEDPDTLVAYLAAAAP